MSLQLAAQHMASRGRGPDTTLVHMAPQEVAGLQALAKAHGGSLTTNPDTGLPEAGFLSSILPMVIGGALTVASGGALTPLMAAGITGAGYGVATGSLSKGLMAGLGAFGGAGLAGGLTAAGTGALSSAAGTTAANAVTPVTAVASEAAPAIAEGVGSTAGTQIGSTLANPTGIPGYSGTGLGLTPPPSAINAGQMAAQAVPTVTQAPALSQSAADIGNIYAQEQAAQNAVGTALKSNTGFSAGLSELGKDPSRFMTMENAKYAMAAGLPMLMQEPEAAEKKPEEKPWMYSYDPGRVAEPYANRSGAYTGEVMHFNPTYTRLAAGGGLMDIGPVEAMSDRNQAETMMANGGMRYAEGGETKAVKPVEENPYYTMSGQSGDAFKYLMGQGQKPAPVVAAPAPAPAAAPAPAPAPVQPAVSAPASTMGGLTQSPDGNPLSATLRPYTFDPATGTFTAMPVIEPVVAAPLPFSTPNEGGGYAGGNSADAANGASGLGTGVSGFGSNYARGGIAALAQGGQSPLGDYSDGGRLLRGPGDGVSDSIPASIGDKRPARLADGEFVVPARIVSELGNGSTEAGARKLYAMMDRVQKARKKSIGKNRVAVNSRAEKLLPV